MRTGARGGATRAANAWWDRGVCVGMGGAAAAQPWLRGMLVDEAWCFGEPVLAGILYLVGTSSCCAWPPCRLVWRLGEGGVVCGDGGSGAGDGGRTLQDSLY